MKLKRTLALLLTLAMLLSVLPVYGLAEDDADVSCTCNTVDDNHAEDCALKAGTQEPVCTCNTVDDNHAEDCALKAGTQEPVCTCNTADGNHTEDCALNAGTQEPVCTCNTADGNHAEDCALNAGTQEPVCTCNTADGNHTEDCALNAGAQEPVCTCGTATEEHAENCDITKAANKDQGEGDEEEETTEEPEQTDNRTAYERMMAGTKPSEVYAVVLDASADEESPLMVQLMGMSMEQILDVKAHVESLPADTEEEEEARINMLDTLLVLTGEEDWTGAGTFAASPVWLGGVQLNSETYYYNDNGVIKASDTPLTDNYVYHYSDTNILDMKNFSFTSNYRALFNWGGANYSYYHAMRTTGVTLRLFGDNYLKGEQGTGTSNSDNYTVTAIVTNESAGTVTIVDGEPGTAVGTLTCEAEDNTSTSNRSYSNGINVCSLKVESGKLIAHGGKARASRGIVAGSEFVMTGGEVEAVGGECTNTSGFSSSGIATNYGNAPTVKITGGKLYAKGGISSTNSYGIAARGISIANATVTAEASAATTNSYGFLVNDWDFGKSRPIEITGERNIIVGYGQDGAIVHTVTIYNNDKDTVVRTGTANSYDASTIIGASYAPTNGTKLAAVNSYLASEWNPVRVIPYVWIGPEDFTIEYKVAEPKAGGTVGLNKNGETSATSTSESGSIVEYTPIGAIATPAKGYAVTGWYLDEACTQPVPANEAQISADQTIIKPVIRDNKIWDNRTYYVKFESTVTYTDLTVTKKVYRDADGLANPDQEFSFTLTGEAPMSAETLEAVKTNASGNETPVSLTMSDDYRVTFSLKMKETMKLSLPVGMDYTLTETVGDGFHTPTIVLNGGSPRTTDTLEGTVSENGDAIVVTNKQVHDLTIKKSVDDAQAARDPDQTFLFTVTRGDEFIARVVLKANASVTIKELVYGTYTVTEDTGWSWRYTANTASKQVVLDEDQTVTFVNTRDEDKWLDGNHYVENTFDGSSN